MRRNFEYFLKQTTILILLCLVFGCRKIDQGFQNEQSSSLSYSQLEQKFFNISNADSEVQKVANDIKKQDSIFKFLPDFIKKNGIPKWDKVLYQVRKGENITSQSNGGGSNSFRSGSLGDEVSQGVFLIPLQASSSADIKSYITAYKHNDSLYTYRLYNRDSLSSLNPDSINTKKRLLDAEAVFGYFEKSINGKDSISVTSPSNGQLTNVQIEFNPIDSNGRHSNSARVTDITCEMTLTLTIEYEWRDFVYGDSGWVPVSVTLEINLTCTGDGGGGYCDCNSLDPNGGGGTGSYWWQYGSGWPWYGSGGIPNYYVDPNQPWYPWWSAGGGGGGVGGGLFPPADVTEIDVSQILDPCLLAIIANIGAPGHTSFLLKTYDQQQYTPSIVDKYKIKYVTDYSLTNSNGQFIAAHTDRNVLPDGTNEIVITLNPNEFSNSSKEWVTTLILHEMMHGILLTKRPDLALQPIQHEWMFDNKVPITIYQSLIELFPTLDAYDALAMGMQGMDDGIFMQDPNNPGQLILKPNKDSFAQQNYYQSIAQARDTALNYKNGTLGHQYC